MRFIRNKSKVLLIVFAIFSLNLNAQEKKVLVTNTESGNVIVKWYSKQLWFEHGVNIYRKEVGLSDWNKLNLQPIVKQNKIASSEIQKDSSLLAFVDIIEQTPKGKLEGFSLLSCIIKSIQSEVFAKYLGVIYHDNSIVPGEKYVYKVARVIGKTDIEFGVSAEIEAGVFKPGNPPEEIVVEPGNHRASIKWKPDEENYFAVNIYRSSNKESNVKRVNDLPIMLSTYTDEDGKEKYPEYFFKDDSLNYDYTYYYELTSIDFFGRESSHSEKIEVIIKDKLPPPPPYNLRRKVDKYNVGISWDIAASDDLFGFNVYRSSNDKDYRKVNKKLLNKTDTTFSETFEKSSYYYYRVAAVDKAGNEALSNKVLLKVEDNTPPARPKNLKAVADTGLITLTWVANNEDDLSGYIIFRKLSKADDNSYVLITPSHHNKNSFTDSLAKNIKNKFTYRIAAVDSAFNVSAFSNIVSAQMPDILPPERPVIINSVSKETGVQIEWLKNVEPDLKGYDIYRISNEDTTKINARTISPEMNVFSDRFAELGVRYNYMVVAVDNDNNQSYPSKPFPGMVKKNTLDKSLVGKLAIKYKKNKKQAVLSWDIQKQESYKGVIVYRKQDEGTFMPLTGLADITTYTDKDIISNTRYFYKVKVFDATGLNTISNIIEIVIEQ